MSGVVVWADWVIRRKDHVFMDEINPKKGLRFNCYIGVHRIWA